MGFFVSNSILPSHYQSAHAVFSNSTNVAHYKNISQYLEILKVSALSDINSTVKPNSRLAKQRLLICNT